MYILYYMKRNFAIVSGKICKIFLFPCAAVGKCVIIAAASLAFAMLCASHFLHFSAVAHFVCGIYNFAKTLIVISRQASVFAS